MASFDVNEGAPQPAGTLPLAIANISVDARSPLLIPEQICQAVRTAIWTKELPPGTRLPTTRELARYLGVGRNTIVCAYARLASEGLCVSNTRRGTSVAIDLPAQGSHAETVAGTVDRSSHAADFSTSLQTRNALETRICRTPGGVPFVLLASDPVQYPRTKLGRRLAEKFLNAPQNGQFGATCDRFQNAIVSYLRQARGVECEPSQVIAVSGLENALHLAARVLLDPGDCVQVEDPSMDIVQSAFRAARAHVRAIPDRLFCTSFKSGEEQPARLFFVSPSVNFPYGMPMPEARRLEVLEAARAQNAIVFENDTWFELRYSGANQRSIQGQDRDGRVIYFGGFEETLGNSIRAGYLVVPPRLLDPFVEFSRRLSCVPARQVQEALAEFIDEREFAMHARNVRALYAKRLEHVKQACREIIPYLDVSEPLGGLHVVLKSEQRIDAVSICEATMAEGIPVRPLAQYRVHKEVDDALVLGFGAISERAIEPMVKRLANICAQYVDSDSPRHNLPKRIHASVIESN